MHDNVGFRGDRRDFLRIASYGFVGTVLGMPGGGTATAYAREQEPTEGESEGILYSIGEPKIFVSKPENLLYIYDEDREIRRYTIMLGSQGGSKRVRDDNKTPEGSYYICEKSENTRDFSLGSRWMRLSYPNAQDAEFGLRNGIIDRSEYNEICKAIENEEIPPQNTKLGSGIGIHGIKETELSRLGLPFLKAFHRLTGVGMDISEGCIMMDNCDIEEIYPHLPLGTTVEIIG